MKQESFLFMETESSIMLMGIFLINAMGIYFIF
jgi:hypothetical protein